MPRHIDLDDEVQRLSEMGDKELRQYVTRVRKKVAESFIAECQQEGKSTSHMLAEILKERYASNKAVPFSSKVMDALCRELRLSVHDVVHYMLNRYANEMLRELRETKQLVDGNKKKEV